MSIDFSGSYGLIICVLIVTSLFYIKTTMKYLIGRSLYLHNSMQVSESYSRPKLSLIYSAKSF